MCTVSKEILLIHMKKTNNPEEIWSKKIKNSKNKWPVKIYKDAQPYKNQ